MSRSLCKSNFSRSRSALLLALLASGCGGSPTASVSSPQVDVLNYVLGQDSAWPRIGTQQQDQLVEPNRVCWVKYGRAEMFECWRWDTDYVYHEVDHALDGDTGGSYHFTDGRWLPRHLTPGTRWSLDVTSNQIVERDRGCDSAPARAFPYRMEAEVRDGELQLSYTPYDPRTGTSGGGTEQFSFRPSLGWFRWSRGAALALFDRPGGTRVPRTRFCEE